MSGDDVDLLRERIALLERDLLGSEIVYPHEWRVTPTERRIIGLLLCRVQASTNQLQTALYFDRSDDWPTAECIKIMVHKLRRLRKYGLKINTLWGYGFQIPEPIRSHFREAFEYTYTKAY